MKVLSTVISKLKSSRNDHRFQKSLFFLVLIFLSQPGLAAMERGLGLEAGFGLEKMDLTRSGQRGQFNGPQASIGLGVPLSTWDWGAFELTVHHRETFLSNVADDALQGQWGQMRNTQVGLRFVLSSLFIGGSYGFANGKFLDSSLGTGPSEVSFNPLTYQAGIVWSVSQGAQIMFYYQQTQQDGVLINGNSFDLSQQGVGIQLRVDFGQGFRQTLKQSF